MAEHAVTEQRRTGRRLLWLVAPHFVLGAWLAIVPDAVAPLVTQLVVLGHVVLALVTLPFLALWLWLHARKAGLRPSASRCVETLAPRMVRAAPEEITPARRRPAPWTALVLTLGATATGMVALWSGEGTLAAALHCALSFALGAPLAAHLMRETRRALFVTSLAVGSAAVAFTVLRFAVPIEADAVPPFALQTRATSEYEAAAWCGSCHSEIFDEWRHSTHARAMKLPTFREALARDTVSRGRSQTDIDLSQVDEVRESSMCTHCHAPLTVYGDDPTPALAATGEVNEGVTCSFCHTLRGLRGDMAVPARDKRDFPFYVSAPQSVRQYLGQGSSSWLAREVGDLLIRLRPEIHRRDYAVPFLRGEQVCAGCHFSAYESWRGTSLAASPAPVLCQDCHMVRKVTGEARREPGQVVHWGAERPQRRSHYFGGGNVRAALQMKDPHMAAQESKVRSEKLRLRFESLSASGLAIRARIVVQNVGVGHRFPGMEAQEKFSYVQLLVLDEKGTVLASTPVPAPMQGPVAPGTLFFQQIEGAEPAQPPPNTSIDYGKSRTFDLILSLGRQAANASRVEARLISTFDPTPAAVAVAEFPR